MNKKQTAVRLTKEAEEILEKYSKKFGVAKAAIFEISLRAYDKMMEKENEQKENRIS